MGEDRTRLYGDGFSVKPFARGRYGMYYEEKGRRMLIGAEPLVGGGFVIYEQDMSGWEGEEAVLSADEKRRIISNVVEAFRNVGEVVEVDPT
jgi:hypothetical protein